MSEKTTWVVTYQDGDVDIITAHAYQRVNGYAQFRDEGGDLVGEIRCNDRSIIREDVLEPLDDDEVDDEGEPCTVAEAKVTLYHASGTVDEFSLSVVDGCHYLVNNAVEEVEPTADGWARFRSTGATSVSLELHGKGDVVRVTPSPDTSATQPMPAELEETP